MKVGFIGVGNMAKAIIQGWLKTKAVNPEEIIIHSKHPANYQKYAVENHLQAVESNQAVVEQTDIVFLAVKPQVVESVLAELRETFQRVKPIIVSMVTGFSIKQIQSSLNIADLEILRIMPNVNVEIAAGMTALAPNKQLAMEHLKICKDLLNSVGKTLEIPENDFSVFVALAGSSPAFVYFFIDAMSRAGVKYGFSKSQATEIAAQAVLGSAQKVLASSKSPWDLVDDVSSPGGTTVAGLLAMEEAGFMTSVIKGIDATIAKDQGRN